jgi:hypothetical protein
MTDRPSRSIRNPDTSGVPPCPDWCELKPGHEYDGVDYQGHLVRSHCRTFGDVEMVQEDAANPGHPQTDPELYAFGDTPMTSGQARELAASLIEAADMWDSVRP